MKFYVSYFYAVRFMKPNTVPLSTAHFDPKWFYNGKQGNVYKDKRGVMNGLRAIPFVPAKDWGCRGADCCSDTPDKCYFLTQYRKQLAELDFDDMMRRFQIIADKVVKNGEEPEIVLLVHEAPDNKCSERWALLDWFKSHNIEAQEYPFEKVKKEKVFQF